MSDTGNAAAPAAGANAVVDDKLPAGGAAAGGSAGAAGAVGGGTLDDLIGDDAADAGAGAVPQTWPDDWRDRLASGDEALGKRLKRFASPENLIKSYRELEKKLSSASAQPAAPGEGATPEEIAEWRKAVGIPETPDGYGVGFGEGVQISEAEAERLAGFTKFMHERNVPPDGVKAAFEWYRQSQEAAATAFRDHQAEMRVELRKEYGADVKRNLAIMDDYLEARGLSQILYATLPDGRIVMHDLASVKALIADAREAADPQSLVAGDVGGGGKSADEEYRDLIKKSQAIGSKLTPDEERRLLTLGEARVAREERSGRKRAA